MVETQGNVTNFTCFLATRAREFVDQWRARSRKCVFTVRCCCLVGPRASKQDYCTRGGCFKKVTQTRVSRIRIRFNYISIIVLWTTAIISTISGRQFKWLYLKNINWPIIYVQNTSLKKSNRLIVYTFCFKFSKIANIVWCETFVRVVRAYFLLPMIRHKALHCRQWQAIRPLALSIGAMSCADKTSPATKSTKHLLGQ